tara:strand:- start:238 stop:411 length:174 start_codon:yes stop_codon:yes gene_type:complete
MVVVDKVVKPHHHKQIILGSTKLVKDKIVLAVAVAVDPLDRPLIPISLDLVKVVLVL